MLQRRQRQRSGIQRAPERHWRKHEQWVRGWACVAFKVDPDGCSGKIQCCHHRTAANSGTGIKPHAWETWPGCAAHHTEQHRIGQKAFEIKYGVDCAKEAARLARISPDLEMRQAMKEAGFV